jgi:hypothetical protein
MEFVVRGITEFDEPGVFVAFEESRDDLVANVSSMGFDLAQFEADGMLVLDHVNVVGDGLQETGDWDLDGLLLRLAAAIDAVGAKRIAIDTNEVLFSAFEDTATLRSALRRLFGWLKDCGVTAVITGEQGDGKLTRRGIEEYVSDCVLVPDEGIELADVYVGPHGVLTGSARRTQQAQDRSDGTAQLEDLEQRRVSLERRRESVEAQAAALWREFDDEVDAVERLLSHGSTGVEDTAGQRAEQGRLRGADEDAAALTPGGGAL